MSENANPWDLYARKQACLARRQQVDDRAWGLEAALNKLADRADEEASEPEAERAARSESRKERYRAALRAARARSDTSFARPEDAVVARIDLARVLSNVPKTDREILRSISEGFSYEEIGSQVGRSAGSLRVRITRLRDTRRSTDRGRSGGAAA
jgi:DNA-directed RNA polymerase specialized sigma24 family protein